jgi:hypothetical protein
MQPFKGEAKEGTVNFSLYGCVTILAAVLALVFTPCAYAFVKRLEARTNHPLGEEVGAHKAVLSKLRKRESMSQAEVEYAAQLISDSRSPLAYSIPATIFTVGCFYVFGCLEQLHGARISARPFIGLIPMLAATNLAIQLLRVARLKGRLQEASSTWPEESAAVTHSASG